MTKGIAYCVFFIIVLSAHPYGLQAQNLIPDPGFEDWNGDSGFLSGLNTWYEATGTPDHHHINNTGTNLDNINPLCDPSITPNAQSCGPPYMGLGTLGVYKENGLTGGREWAGTELIEPMIDGNCYEIKYYLASKHVAPGFENTVNQWGIFFSTTEFPTVSINVVNYNLFSDHFVTSQELIIDGDWHENFFNYKAAGNYSHIFAGYVGNVADQLGLGDMTGQMLGQYFWFDEISIVDVTPQLTVSSDVVICPGDSTYVVLESNYDVEWTDGTSVENSTEFWIKPDVTTEIYVKTLDTTECTKFDTITITVFESPTNQFAEDVCDTQESFIIDPNSPPGTWAGNGIIDGNTGEFDPELAGIGTHNIVFTANSGCFESSITSINVITSPNVDFLFSEPEGCLPVELIFENISAGDFDEVLWDFGNGSTDTHKDTAMFVYTQAGVYDVGLTIEYSEFCVVSELKEDLVIADETPLAGFTWNPLNPSNIEPDVDFIDTSTPNVTDWSWDFGDSTYSVLSDPSHTYLSPGAYDVKLIVEALSGCSDSITTRVNIDSQIKAYIPNVFSPNRDGVNDRFDIGIIGLLHSYKLSIFDRWGNLIYVTETNDISWDGSSKGIPVNSGVYAYVLEYSVVESKTTHSEIRTIFGEVTIIK